MNKREAQQKLVAYKNEKREEQYELEHGILSNFKAKYLEKIPLGNGKFRYIYEEAKDKVKSTASKVTDAVTDTYNKASNLVKTGSTNPGKMTENEKKAREQAALMNDPTQRALINQLGKPVGSGSNRADSRTESRDKATGAYQAREARNSRLNKADQIDASREKDISYNSSKKEESSARKAAAEEMQRQVRDQQYMNRQKDAKGTGSSRADRLEEQRDISSGRTKAKEESAARKAAIEKINTDAVDNAVAKRVSDDLDSRMAKNGYSSDSARKAVSEIISERAKNDKYSINDMQSYADSVLEMDNIDETSYNAAKSIMKKNRKYHEEYIKELKSMPKKTKSIETAIKAEEDFLKEMDDKESLLDDIWSMSGR